MLFAFVAKEYTARVTGRVVRDCDCEWCGRQFQYTHQASAVGGALTPFGLFPASSRRLAEARAEKNLRAALETGVTAAPCPHCGRYQPDMFAAAGRQRFRNWRRAAKVFGWLSIPLLFPAVFAATVVCYDGLELRGPHWDPIVFAGGVAVAAAPALTLYAVYRWKCWTHDPNADAAETADP